ncbi:MAG TPA: FAD-binding oxidoreductase [Thermoanaerobaculia bacterium]|nr:FAD-binding oxidoreductase [Thermoanaerobaculia bacterium]
MSGAGGDLPRSADVVVLGAGVMGASIAFHLARRGAGRVLVLDKGDVASGGSGRSSALVRMHYSFPPEVDLAVRSLAIFRAWRDYVGRDGHFRQTGFVRIVPESELPRLEQNVAMQRSRGVDARVVDRRELAAIAPAWNVDDVPYAAWEPGSGHGDGAGVATDFLERAREMGVTYRSQTRATRFLVDGGRVAGVDTDRGAVSAPVVVAATGPWSRPLFARVGFDLPVEGEYHEVAILKDPPGSAGVGPACIDGITTTYFRPEVGGLTLVGDFWGKRGVDPDSFSPSATSDSLAGLVARAVGRVPALEDAAIWRGVTGVYDVSPDFRPLIGQTPGVRGLWIVCGFSGMGFKISPAVGLAVSELLLDGRASSVDIAAFDPERFARGELIKAEFEYGDEEPAAYT